MTRQDLVPSYDAIRRMTEHLCEPLVTEDFVVQSIPDVSPPKWHLGHTTWFFERVILQQFSRGYRPVDDRYSFVFNSYYQSFGERVARNSRGTLSRPTVSDIIAYRTEIDRRMHAFLDCLDAADAAEVTRLVELGLHHEQQHQELLVTDIKHNFASNPLQPVYRPAPPQTSRPGAGSPAPRLIPVEGGIFEMGAPETGFAWDNERPRHKVLLSDFALMNRPVTCGEYIEFVKDGGYRNPLLWLSDGWDAVTNNGWEAPLYWSRSNGGWSIMTLSGNRPVDPDEPVAHVSFFEADAFARWKNMRLPTEAEWEKAVTVTGENPSSGNFLENGYFHPVSSGSVHGNTQRGMMQLFGDVWEWTGSSYLPYPGYRQERGPLGEYNGKFMSNQMILRGGSCATPRSHIRATYRNFFQCDKRWQFTGIRLASDKT